jgi:streptomycin 6-kinase
MDATRNGPVRAKHAAPFFLTDVRVMADDAWVAGVAGVRSLIARRAWPRPGPPEEAWIPPSLDRWREVRGGREWLDTLPDIVRACAAAWRLRLGEPYNGGKVGLALRVERADGSPAVLKVSFPQRETRDEAAALAHWRGEGAVRLLERDDERYALLVERCDPGFQLSRMVDEDEANRAAAHVLLRIWRRPPERHQFGVLEDEAARRAEEIAARWAALGRPFERTLLDAGLAAYQELGSAQEEAVVCHQDFHGGNVLRSSREAWLAIDPKPIVGERAFDTTWLLRDRRASVVADPHPRRRMRRRLDLLSSELGLDRERMRGWGIACALTWGTDAGRVHPGHIEFARLLLAV